MSVQYNSDKVCENPACGKTLVRKTWGDGNPETTKKFAARRFCSRPCWEVAVTRTHDVPETKPCEFCGTEFGRKRYKGGSLEYRANFLQRRFCTKACAGQGRAAGMFNEEQKQGYRSHSTGECEACGELEELHVHHVDLNHANDDPENLQTLCAICHGFWHRLIGRTRGRIKGRMPRIF